MPSWRFGCLGRDKYKHFLAGVGISLCVSLLLEILGAPYTRDIGFAVALVVGVGKEVFHDWLMGRGTPEVLDALCTAAGGAMVLLLL